jgi:hypothetical protein
MTYESLHMCALASPSVIPSKPGLVHSLEVLDLGSLVRCLGGNSQVCLVDPDTAQNMRILIVCPAAAANFLLPWQGQHTLAECMFFFFFFFFFCSGKTGSLRSHGQWWHQGVLKEVELLLGAVVDFCCNTPLHQYDPSLLLFFMAVKFCTWIGRCETICYSVLHFFVQTWLSQHSIQFHVSL